MIKVMERPSAADRFTPAPKDVNTNGRTFRKCEIEFLRKEFAKNRHPTSSEFVFISQELGVPVQKVKVKNLTWMKNDFKLTILQFSTGFRYNVARVQLLQFQVIHLMIKLVEYNLIF